MRGSHNEQKQRDGRKRDRHDPLQTSNQNQSSRLSAFLVRRVLISAEIWTHRSELLSRRAQIRCRSLRAPIDERHFIGERSINAASDRAVRSDYGRTPSLRRRLESPPTFEP